ncbi:hypothetical protein A0H81_05902 [Grifola frondosa]|uniref:Uncharacterized protein n=1 Tax=Grifola frondosa TaxID=5627 RepID=A0A1C7MBH1_GRIFR|nr:hypothetical protein A0H81_05902 [Grifola frondosa]
MFLSPTARLLRVWPRRAHRARRHPRALAPTLGRAALQWFPASARRATMRAHTSRSLLQLYSSSGCPPSVRTSAPLGHSILDSLVCRPYCGLLERLVLLVRARPPHRILHVRSHWARRAQSLFLASCITLLAGSGMALSSCSMSFALYPISSLESYAAPQFAQNCWPSLRTRCGPRALLRAHAARSSLRPNGHATGHIVAFRALARIRGSSPWIVGDHASPRSLIMTAGSVLRPTSSSASIDAILNVFIATRSRSGHSRPRLSRTAPQSR